MPGKIDIKVIIDKDFALNYFEAGTCNPPVCKDFENEFLSTTAKKTLICNFNNEEAFYAAVEDNPLLELISECIPDLIINDWSSKEECIKNYGTIPGIKIFFMDLPDRVCKELSYETGCLVINTSNFNKQWENYIIKIRYSELDLPSDSKEEHVFKDWSDLKLVSKSPNCTIIIQDNFILADRAEKISDNLLPLIEAILPVGLSKEVDILIISENIKENERNKPLKERATEVHRFLNSRLAKYREMKLNLSIVHLHKNFNPTENPDFHDRHIYTNYYTIKCGHGFNLFRGNKRIISNSEIEIKFNLESRQMRILPRRLEAIVKYVEKLKRTESLEGFKYYPEIKCSILGYG